MGKFHGNFEELKQAVVSTAKVGEWTEGKGAQQTFRAKTGEVLNWWPSRGTLLFQGNGPEHFEAELAKAIGSPVPANKPTDKPKIFVVHGHDRDAREQLELILRRLGLNPFILQNSDGGGKTIVEALEQSI